MQRKENLVTFIAGNRDKTLDAITAGSKSTLEQLSACVPPALENLADFPNYNKSMTPKVCLDWSSMVGKAETFKTKVDAVAAAWGVSGQDLCPGITLADEIKRVLKAVVLAFAGRTLVSQAAKNKLKAASQSADKGLKFAADNNTFLPPFVQKALEDLRDANPQ